jgi:hypothetical protein
MQVRLDWRPNPQQRLLWWSLFVWTSSKQMSKQQQSAWVTSKRLSIRHKGKFYQWFSHPINHCAFGSWLFPALEPEFLVRQIIESIEIAQEMVILPKFLHFVRFIQSVTPTRFSDMLFSSLANDAYRELESHWV